MKISAIISTYNRARFLPGLFDSLKGQTLPPDQFEILIINNNSIDETEFLSREFADNSEKINVRYFTETNQGLSYARNRGIKEAVHELVTFIDDDALPAEDFLEKTVLFFDEHPEAGAAGGKILLQFMDRKPDWYNRFLSPLLGYFNYGDRTRLFKHNYFRGSNMTFRKLLFDTFEPFDTRLGRFGNVLTGGEEKELFYRLKNNGIQLWYIADAVVYHLVPEERTTVDFIREQAIGTGRGKRIQAQIEGTSSLIKTLMSEDLKWAASIFISLFYFITFRFRKGIMIIRFRYWVSMALLMS
ncbi:MAG: glycosyltransferase [Bacteroidia bacterium]|nr:glycosyltransferase [Bacteroidia bacterium]